MHGIPSGAATGVSHLWLRGVRGEPDHELGDLLSPWRLVARVSSSSRIEYFLFVLWALGRLGRLLYSLGFRNVTCYAIATCT